jgi:hypothetical protein
MSGLMIAWRTPLLALFILGVGLSGAGYAFAAANTVPTSKADDGVARSPGTR